MLVVLSFLGLFSYELDLKLGLSSLVKESSPTPYIVPVTSSNGTIMISSSPAGDAVSVTSPTAMATDDDKNAGMPKTIPSVSELRLDQELKKEATLVIQLSGEMANNLQHIAHGLGVRWMAKEEFGIDMNLLLRHYEGPDNKSKSPKWKEARDDIQACFPNLASKPFNEGNKKRVFSSRQSLQRQWLGDEKIGQLAGHFNSGNLTEIAKGLQLLSNDVLLNKNRPALEDNYTIRMPFITVETLDAFAILDRYYTELKKFFFFNETACCGSSRPGLTDAVFHFRNFESEMPAGRAFEKGYAELSPSKVANELFETNPLQDACSSYHVYITTRFFNRISRQYVEALQKQQTDDSSSTTNITNDCDSKPTRTASMVKDQTGVQDFCFMKRAQTELVGSARSTFVLWAALLSTSMQRARLYHVDNRGLRERYPNFWRLYAYNFTHPELQDKIVFQLYESEKQ